MTTLLLFLLSNVTIPEEYTERVFLRMQEEVVEMSMDKGQLRDLIQRTLKVMEPEIPYSEHAVELLMLTCAQESHLGTYIKQIKGPALGIFQMEPNTEEDIWVNYLEYKEGLREVVSKFIVDEEVDRSSKIESLESNLVYAIMMARVHYRRVPKALPTDLEGYASYWKEFYNTPLGRGTEEEAIENYRRLAI